MRPRRFLILPLTLLLVAAGCREAKVSSYRIPKEAEPTPPPAAAAAMPPAAPAPSAPGNPMDPNAMMASTPVATAQGAGLAWTGPSGWSEKPASGMRKGTFTIAGEGGLSAELAITAFPGDVGGTVANVNRWRGQIQLPAAAAAEIEAGLIHLDTNGLHIDVVELVSKPDGSGTRVLGAMVPHDGSTWFFKLTGPDALVLKEKPAFFEFLKTIKAR